MNLLDHHLLEAADHFGTPLYLYESEKIRNGFRRLRKYMHPSMRIFYSLKANPLLGISELLKEEKADCEVCSEAELHIALKAGFHPNRIIFVGPGKNRKELELCIKHSIYAVVCESFEELMQLNHLARRYDVECNVLLRINPHFFIPHAPLKMSGKPTQFGIDLSLLQKNIKQILCYSHIKIRGIHIYNGTRILDEEAIIQNSTQILQLAKKLSREWGIEFECIDMGGGFGIPYFKGESSLDLERIFFRLNQEIESYLQYYPKTNFILESGRYLVGEVGVLLARVLSVKTSHQENFVITDAGMSCHFAATGLGSFVQRNFPIDVISKKRSSEKSLHCYNLTGPLCTPGDIFARQVDLPKIRVGDLIVIRQSGAYGASASPGRFLSRGFPAEVLLDKGKFNLLKRRETVEDIFSTQQSLKAC